MKVVWSDGLALEVKEYKGHDPKALLICVHGMAEHRGRYDELAAYLKEQGYVVLTYDHRGHGQSILRGERKGYLGVDGFNKMVRDLEAVVCEAKKQYPLLPLYLFGHSMGSFVVQRYIQVHHDVNGVILMGSGYKPKGLSFGILLSGLMVKLGRGKREGYLIDAILNREYNRPFRPNRTTFDWLSRDDRSVDRYRDDPDCGFVMSYQFYYDFFRGIRTLQKDKNLRRIPPKLPIFILSGLHDPVGEMGKKIQRLYEAYRTMTSHIDLKLYKDARHELLHELNKEEVFRDLLHWLEKQRVR